MPVTLRQLICWLIHLLTVSSVILGLWAIQCFMKNQMSLAFILILATIIIDSIDGPLARLFDVRRYTPNMDGALLDNIVDYFTWVLVPCLLLITHPLFSLTTTIFLTMAIVIAAGYQFCCKDAKVAGQYFKRYPSAWSGCVLAMYLIHWPKELILLILCIFVLCSFIPVYAPKAFTNATICSNPSLNRLLQWVNVLNQLVILVVLALGSYYYPHKLLVSSILMGYFLAISFLIQTITTIHQYKIQKKLPQMS